MLTRMATVKDDGTVEFEIPGDVEQHALGIGCDAVNNTLADDELADVKDERYIPPMQIVMLIVGTRGDVQPFIAIGKRLQVILTSFSFLFLSPVPILPLPPHFTFVNGILEHFLELLINIDIVTSGCTPSQILPRTMVIENLFLVAYLCKCRKSTHIFLFLKTTIIVLLN